MSAIKFLNNNLTQEVKSFVQICPKCGGNCNLTNDGLFLISECENKHKLKCSIKEFENNQIIRLPINKINCDICSVEDKDDTFFIVYNAIKSYVNLAKIIIFFQIKFVQRK